MIDQAVLEYIRTNRTSGITDEDTKKALVTAGWTDPDITSAFTALSVSRSQPVVAAAAPATPAEPIAQAVQTSTPAFVGVNSKPQPMQRSHVEFEKDPILESQTRVQYKNSAQNTTWSPDATSVPAFAKFLAFLGYLGAIVYGLFGIFLLGASFVVINRLNQFTAKYPALEATLQDAKVMTIVLGVFFILLSWWAFWVNAALWRGKSWARMLTVILYGLATAVILSQYFLKATLYQMLPAVVPFLLLLYFILSKKVRAAYATPLAKDGQVKGFILSFILLIVILGGMTGTAIYFSAKAGSKIVKQLPTPPQPPSPIYYQMLPEANAMSSSTSATSTASTTSH